MPDGMDHEATPVGHRARWGRPVSATAGVLAVLALGVLAAGAGSLDSGMYGQLGLPVPATGQRLLAVGLRAVVAATSAAALGSLVFAGLLAPAQATGTVAVDGYRAIRRAGWSAAVAGLGGLLLAVSTAADLSGATVLDVLAEPNLLAAFAALEEPMGWLLLGIGFCVVALCCVWLLSWRAATVTAVLSAVAVLPPSVVGQAAVGRAHDWATDAAVLQTLGFAGFLGVLVAVLAQQYRGVDPTAWRRARRLLVGSALCWLLGTAVLAPVLVVPGSLAGTVWGRWQLVQVALAVLAAVLYRVIGRRGPRRVLLAALVAVSGLVAVTSATMAHSVPPRFPTRVDSEGEVLIGYNLQAPFSAARALFDWRVNILCTLFATVVAGWYLLGVRTLRRRGDRWPAGRTAAWLGGCAVVVLVTSSGIGRYAPSLFSVHMISHMALNMLAPVLLALGGPVTLTLRALRPAGAHGVPGLREWVAAAVNSSPAQRLTHPLVTLALFVGSFYALYFTPLFETALRFHWAHQLMNVHFLAVGYLFFWPLIGVDRAPTRLPHLARLAVLLAAMPFHAFFGITLMSADDLIGSNFYGSLALPWVADRLGDQRVGGGLAWATGEIPTLVVVIALLVQWSREDDRTAARYDRQAGRDDDADLREYNEMLAQLARTRR